MAYPQRRAGWERLRGRVPAGLLHRVPPRGRDPVEPGTRPQRRLPSLPGGNLTTKSHERHVSADSLPLSPLTVAETSCGSRGGSLLARGPDHEAVRSDAYPDLTIDGSARSLNQTGVAERSAANTTQLTQTESRLRALETPQSIVIRPGADEG